ncbi:MAG: acyl-CoA thioesterase [Proteobacteria bacterium]|nr:acyl-CoA thioesterase [Pseudomonadota bacterium]MBU1685865.1 acyl-CoA thioesterase [Pseudomonadota bacterium]
MGFLREYFQRGSDDPEPLTVTAVRRVRFEEVDMLRIVWHGHYVSYLDDGRVAFGDRFPTVSYDRLRREMVAAPIVQLHLDYHSPLVFDEEMHIETTLHWADSLRLNFTYRITGGQGKLAVKGYTVQLMTDLEGRTILIPPDWVQAFRDQWRNGDLR